MKDRLKVVDGDYDFTSRERHMFVLFWKAGFNKDVPIETMYKKYHGLAVVAGEKLIIPSPRMQQMSIGTVVTRLNRKLKGTRIIPGVMKRTYRLVNV